MKFKNLILAVSLFFVGTALADDFIITQKFYPATGTSIEIRQITLYNSSLSEAFRAELSYCNIGFNTNTFLVNINFAGSAKPPPYAVSNVTAGVLYTRTQNFEYNRAQTFCQCFLALCQKYRLDIFGLGLLNPTYCYVSSGVIYPREFNFYTFEQNVYQVLSAVYLLELTQSIATFQQIQTDVSSIVPSLESHASNVSNLAQIVSSTAGISTNLQHDIYSQVYDINYVLQSSAGLSAINDKLSMLDPSLASSYVLCGAFADVMGMSGYPHQALISAGLATDFQDAENKISDQNWAHTVLAPVFNSQKRKNAYIQQFQKDGITPPAGKTWDQLSENELETIANYSYNTPVSSNATLNAHALDYLKHIKESNASIDASVDDLRQHIQGGPLEVNVMNWPDDIFGAANISNMFNDLISNFEASLTNFNPHYTWEDALFFDRSQYSWRGLNTLDFDPRHDPNSSPIGVSTFNFTPSGNYFQDVPNFLALQSRISVDIANMIATVTAYSQTNLADRASTADLEQQYQEEFLQQSAEALNEFEQAQSYSNLFARNARFIDTSSVFSTPSGFTEIFSGNHSIPTHINLQLPSWHFGQDDQSTPDVGSTITIETAQYATFFQNCRYVFLFLYWGITVMIMIWLFRLFTRFISWIPLSLTGGGSHDTVSI